MGTHEKGPAKISGSQLLLSEWLAKNQIHPVCEVGKGETAAKAPPTALHLPFLFKVLSVNQALSIQVHPSSVSLAFLVYSAFFPVAQ